MRLNPYPNPSFFFISFFIWSKRKQEEMSYWLFACQRKKQTDERAKLSHRYRPLTTFGGLHIKFRCSTSSFFFLYFQREKKTSKDDPLIKKKDLERTRSAQSKISIPHNVYFDLGPAYKIPSLDLSSFIFFRERKKQAKVTHWKIRTNTLSSVHLDRGPPW